MALKPDRIEMNGDTDISFFMNETAEKGSVVVLSAGGSGAAMDDSAALAKLSDTSYGVGEVPLGILMCDVVSGDLTKTHLNQHKDEVQVGSKVTILRKGQVTTNMISGTPTAGQGAYVANGANLCGANNLGASDYAAITGGTTSAQFAYPRVGTWLSSKDADGYAKVAINLI
jgi:hypothetical protein